MDRRKKTLTHILFSLIAVSAAFVWQVPSASGAEAKDRDPPKVAFGDTPVDEQYYKSHILTYDALTKLSPVRWGIEQSPEFDARTRGWVTPAKNQASCGCCWAFAAAGTIESRILKSNGPRLDLSEQQQVSCNLDMHGCCGGSGQSLLFYQNNQPWLDTSAPYAEAGTSCPTERTKVCGDLQGTPVSYLATGFYTVERTVPAMKKSLVDHGPTYFRFDVYDDFTEHWYSGTAGTAYTQKTGARRGGHAVLLIGWSDSKKAWLLKNSWGETNGPSRDGTFWMAYEGHATDLKFQMFNFTTLTRTN